MEQRIRNYWKGYVQIWIVGSSYERFLNLCAFHGIALWNLQTEEQHYTACIAKDDFRKMKSIVRKSHARIRIIQKRGLPFFLYKYRKRKIYAAGIAAAAAVILWLSAHIWNIRIDGNVSQTDDVIMEYLSQAGIHHGMIKKQVDCKELASEIRSYFPEFAWVSAELKGTRLLISVKEGITGAASEETQGTSADLVADSDGTVISVLVRSGTALVRAGDMVEKGQILVAGLIPIVDDSKTVTAWQETHADADIVVQKKLSYYDKLALKAVEKKYTGREKTNYLMRIGDMPFAFPDTFEKLGTYDVFSNLTQFRLMEHFYLPVFVQKFTAKEYENREIIYTKEQAAQILDANFQYFIKNLKEKGVQIFENDVKIEWNEKSAVAAGSILVGETAIEEVPVTDRTREELLKHEYG